MERFEDSDFSEFENPFDPGTIEADCIDVLRQVNEPVTAANLAARSGTDPAAVNELLRSFVSLGLVVERGAEPPTYACNPAAFEWDRVCDLAAEHSLANLEDRILELADRIHAYQDRYDADVPEDVRGGSKTGVTETESAPALEAWQAARNRLRRYERARQILD